MRRNRQAAKVGRVDWLYALAALALIACTAPLWPALHRSMRRGRRGGAGAALGELGAFFDPSRRHVERVVEARRLERRNDEPPEV